MKVSGTHFHLSVCLILIGLGGFLCESGAQEVEPRRWSHLPIGGNFGGAAYAYTTGETGFDPVLLLEDVELDMHTVGLKYIRSFELLDKSARIDLFQAYSNAQWEGLLDGVPASTRRSGFSDLTVRVAVNLIGAPPLKGEEFAKYRSEIESETIVGLGLAVQLPTGYYLDDKLLNLGTNRFTFRPQIGIVRACGKWSFELSTAAWIFTDNDEFFAGKERKQKPLYTIQSHVVYTFKPGLWVAAGAAYAVGGQSTINGANKNDFRENAAWGVGVGYPITRRLGINAKYIGLRTQSPLGSDADTFALALSFMW